MIHSKRNTLQGAVALLIVVGLCFAQGDAWAAAKQPIAEVMSITGTVKCLAAGSSKAVALRKGRQVYGGDEIIAEEKGSVQLYYLTEGHYFTLYGPGEMRFDEQGEDESDSVIALFRGRLSAVIKRLSGVKSSWNMETPSAVVGVRGTRFELGVSEDGASLVTVEEGVVSVEAEGGMVELTEGKQSEIEIGERPGRARRFDSTDREWIAHWQTERRKRLAGLAPGKMKQIKKRLKAHEQELRKHHVILAGLLGKQIPRQVGAYDKAVRAGKKRNAAMAAAALKRSLMAARGSYTRIQRLRRQGRHAMRTAGYLAKADPSRREEREQDLRGIKGREEMLNKLEREAREAFLKIRAHIRERRQLMDEIERRERR